MTVVIRRVLEILPPLVTAALGAAALGVWISQGPGVVLTERLPGADHAPSPTAAAPGSLGPIPPGPLPAEAIRGERTAGPAAPSDLPGDWPSFRGPGRDGVRPDGEAAKLARSWPAGGPPPLWALPVGEGYAGPAVHAGRVYLLDYDRENQRDALRCLSLADGREIWRYSYPVKVKRDHGMSRTVPAVTDKYVVSLGPRCHVLCLDADSGEFRWAMDLVRQFGTKVPLWHAGQCPLIDGDRAILAPAGKDALMIGVDCESGQILWTTPNPMGWKMTHSSVAPMEFRGRRMYVYCGSGGVVGVSADDGTILWQTTEWKIHTTVATPVPLPGGKIFLAGGYNKGAMMLQLDEEGGKIIPRVLFRLKPRVFGAAQQTPIFHKGFLYGVRPDGELTCLDPDGKVRWTSGQADRFGLGPSLIADGLILVMDDSGVLTMAAASPDAYVRLARAKVLEGHDSWGPMAIAAGRLLARDLTRMVCLDVAGR